MAGYYEAFTGLSRSLTVLLTAEPRTPGGVSPAAQVPEVLAARDVVTGEVAALIRRLLDAGPASDQDLRLGHLVLQPHLWGGAAGGVMEASGAGLVTASPD